MATTRSAQPATETLGLLVGRVPYGEADLVVTLYTEALGRVSAMARAARKSQRRFGGALEPIHTLRLRLSERPTSELFALESAELAQPRLAATANLAALEAAGTWLGWLRRASPSHEPDAEVWARTTAVLDALDRPAMSPAGAERALAEAGLGLLGALGWGLELTRCVRCARPAPSAAPAGLDATQGGLLCRACGPPEQILSAETRAGWLAAAEGARDVLTPADARALLDVVTRVLETHGAG